MDDILSVRNLSWPTMPDDMNSENIKEYLKKMQGVITNANRKMFDTISSITDTDTNTTTFVGLTDTPANYTGASGKLVAVNTATTGLEFIAP